MNFSKLNFSNLLGGFGYGDRLYPVRDWFILLGILGVILLGGVAWSAYTYVLVKDGEVIGSAPAPAHTVVNRTSLQSVEDLFAERASEVQKYATGAYSFVDPAK